MSPAANVAQFGFSLQTAKGAASAAPQYLVDVTDADFAPTPEIETREETGTGRDVGDSYIKVLAAEGSVSVIARPKTTQLFLYGCLGAKAVTGAGPYTHTDTPANDQPWLTVWRTLGGSIHEKFTDCKITKCEFEWEAGGDLMLSMDILGLDFDRLATMTAGGVYDNGTPFRVPGMDYTIGGTVAAGVITGGTSFSNVTGGSLSIEANQEPLQTTQITNSYLEPTQREISGSLDEIYQAIDRYATILYGSAAGLTPSETIYTAPLQITFGNFASSPALRLTLSAARFTEIEANPDSGGDPLMTPIAFQGGRHATEPICQAVVKNDVATYPAV